MEKFEPSEPIEIPRKSPRLDALIGGKALQISWYNTLIRIYRHPYHDFSHIQVVADGLKIITFCKDEEAMQLMNAHFPVRYDPEPDDHVLQIYAQSQRTKMGREITNILGGEGNE